MDMNDLGRVIALVGALLLTGCQSQWYMQHEVQNLITTEVVIHSDPEGGRIRWQNVPIGRTPVRLPVEYDHVEQLWTRQNNYGARMREDMGTVVTVLTFPVWMIASFFHTTEDRRRHLYGGNEFTVSISKSGYAIEERDVKLEGEDEVNLSVHLKKR
jgi:hypothetical protein